MPIRKEAQRNMTERAEPNERDREVAKRMNLGIMLAGQPWASDILAAYRIEIEAQAKREPTIAQERLAQFEAYAMPNVAAALDRIEAAKREGAREALEKTSRLPEAVRGDGPCADCGTLDNFVWFTDNVFWNAVTGERVVHEDKTGAILCPACFVTRAYEAGFRPTGWRLLPEFPWAEVNKAEPEVNKAEPDLPGGYTRVDPADGFGG